jgi:hypothetical protein
VGEPEHVVRDYEVVAFGGGGGGGGSAEGMERVRQGVVLTDLQSLLHAPKLTRALPLAMMSAGARIVVNTGPFKIVFPCNHFINK